MSSRSNRRIPARDAPWANRITSWAAEHAPNRVFGIDEVAAEFGIPYRSAQSYLSRLAAAGRIVRWWRGAYSTPGTGPFTRPAGEEPSADRIVAFVAAAGGATWGEIRDHCAIQGDTVSGQLTPLVRSGRLVRLDQPGERGGFYVLPGQEPGEIIDPPASNAACSASPRFSDTQAVKLATSVSS